VLAFGDSVTNAGGDLQWGVALQSWALWTARALGLPYTGYAVDGAVVQGVVDSQIPAFVARAADPDGRYDVGCLYIGLNDVRRENWDVARFAEGHGRALAFLGQRCERLLCVTAPRRLGRPPTDPARVAALNEVIRSGAARAGALVVSLEEFGARNLVMVDHVHPTAFGQVAIAQRALAVLAADGMAVRVDPATLIAPSRSRANAVRGDWTYAYRELKQRGRSAWARRGARSRAFDDTGGQ
jgi:lysophospholipase L1-like esterase